MNQKQFKTKCQCVANKLGSPLYFFEDSRGAGEFEDDGSLHITRAGVRACFDVSNGQNDHGAEQNRKTLFVLSALNICATPEVLEQCLVEEAEPRLVEEVDEEFLV